MLGYISFESIPFESIPFELIFFLIAVAIIAYTQYHVMGSRFRNIHRGARRDKVHAELLDCRAKLKILELGQASAAVKFKGLTDYLIENFKTQPAISIINKCVGESDKIDLTAYSLYEKQKIENDMGDAIKDILSDEVCAPQTRAGLLALQSRLRDRLAEMELEKERLNNKIKELEVTEVMLQ